MSCCLKCFDSCPLSDEERAFWGQEADSNVHFKVKLCSSPFVKPCCCLSSVLCCPCAQYSTRYNALNHTEPGSGWSNYTFWQGKSSDNLLCRCIKPGKMGEKSCPRCCMCIEGCCFPEAAARATQGMIMKHYSLALDEDDTRIIQCYKSVKELMKWLCFCKCLCGIDCDEGPCSDYVCETVFWFSCFCVRACMLTRIYHEIKEREEDAPESIQMQR
ncbi:hypothetical protein ACHAXS_010931 [Conticribra weissflogii]